MGVFPSVERAVLWLVNQGARLAVRPAAEALACRGVSMEQRLTHCLGRMRRPRQIAGVLGRGLSPRAVETSFSAGLLFKTGAVYAAKYITWQCGN